MGIRKFTAGVAALAAALSVSGCAAAFGGYDLAENGLPREEAALRRAIAFEPEKCYAEVIAGERPLPEDDLLRLLFAGTAGYYAGTWRESARLLDLASYLAEDRVTLSVSQQALSMITGDRTLDYTPTRTERLMIPYVAAMMYLEAGDYDDAAVEARRIEALLDRMDEGVHADSISDASRFLHYFAATVFEAAGDWNAADVAYRRAGPVTESLGTGRDRDLVAGGDSLGDVIVLVERGFVPHRIEQSVAIVVPPWEVAALTEGSAGDKALAAAEAAARILAAASWIQGERSGWYDDRGYDRGLHLEPWRGEKADCHDHEECPARDADPYILRIAWPVLYQEPTTPAPLQVRAGALAVQEAARLDLTAATRRDFHAERAAVLARTVFRATTKLALTQSARAAVEKRDDTAGHIIGILTNIGTMLTERADTRAWHLLPGSIELVRLRLPAGSHDIAVQVEGGRGGRGRTERLGPVVVRPGTTTFVSTRLWR